MGKSALTTKATHKVVYSKSTLPARVRQVQHGKENSGHLCLQSNKYAWSHSVPNGFAYNFSHIPLHFAKRSIIQPKLRIGTPDDRYEREADNVADTVMRQTENTAFRNPTPAVSAMSRIFIQRQAQEPMEEEEFAVPDNDALEQLAGQQETEVFLPILDSISTRDADELGEDEEDKLIQPKMRTMRYLKPLIQWLTVSRL